MIGKFDAVAATIVVVVAVASLHNTVYRIVLYDAVLAVIIILYCHLSEL